MKRRSRGQLDGILEVFFRLNETSGTPTIDQVSGIGSADISVVDTGTGDFAITIKNFKGQDGVAHVFATCQTISMFASAASISYSGNDLSFALKVENDASTASDSDVSVHVVAY